MVRAIKQKNGSYRVRLELDRDADGKRQRKSFTAPTRRAAEQAALDYMQQQLEEKEKQAAGITFAEAAQEYIDTRRNVISPSTLQSYKMIAKNNIPQELADAAIDDVTQLMVQSVVNDISVGHKPKTVRNVHGFIASVLGLYRPDLQLKTRLPQKTKSRVYIPDQDECKVIADALQGAPLYVPFVLATQCGLRASEISGLEIKDVHPDYISITQARVQGENGAELKTPKTDAGYRDVPITRAIYNLLKAEAAKYDGRVCPLTSHDISKQWGLFRDEQGLPYNLTFHKLRHYYASKCIVLGVPQKYIADLMGHSSTAMIEKIYQHIIPSAARRYAEVLRADSDDFMGTNKPSKKGTRGRAGDKKALKTA